MADRLNFLLGYGERLTKPIPPISGGRTPDPPYTFSQARERLRPMVEDTVTDLDDLPDEACPEDYAVAAITLHPQYVAKSYFPDMLLRELKLEPIGSRPTELVPDRLREGRRPDPGEAPRVSTDLFVAGARDDFRRWAVELPLWTQSRPGSRELFELERIRAFAPDDRVVPIKSDATELVLEVALHHPDGFSFVLEEFVTYLKRLGLRANPSRGFLTGGLFFLPVRTPAALIGDIAQYSFLRVVREMPSLRPIPTITRMEVSKRECSLPDSAPISPDLTAAVFDGGVSEGSRLSPWVTSFDAPGVGPPLDAYLDHGAAVTSALLFGSVDSDNGGAARPYGRVHHYRVLDANSPGDPDELYDVLRRIEKIASANRYEFMNLSIGPDLPIDDEEVHAWTAVLDPLLHRKGALATVAVGNSGELDTAAGLDRIQVPSDCVNALSVGACNSQNGNWARAPYSAVGPGRSPGLIKPDLVDFGGTASEPFWVVDPRDGAVLAPRSGTSFASPAALRAAAGVRAHLGSTLSPVAIKALLIHCAADGGYPREEVGWGRIPGNLQDLVVCPEGVARVVYQGELDPARYIRAQIPVPADVLPGFVEVTATFCFTTDTDPEDPSNYTRHGLDVIFRPHDERRDDGKPNARTSPFFRLKEFESEAELRSDAHKWETTLHRARRFRGTTLKNPVFDIHHNARSGGADSRSGTLRYALIVTVECPKSPDLYDQIVRRYRTQLRPLVPQIQIPVRTRG